MIPESLLFIPYEFPFGYGETFIEAEIGPLAAAFKQCYVMPSRAFFSPAWHAKSKQARPMPPGCELVLPSANTSIEPVTALTTTLSLLGQARDRGEPPAAARFVQEALREAVKAVMFLAGVRHFLDTHPETSLAYTYWKGSASLALAALKAQGRALRLVTRCHGGDLYYDLPEHPSRPYDPYIASWFDQVLPISARGRNHLVARGFEPARTHVSRLGITIPPTSCHASTDGVWRLVSCSNVVPLKRVALLAQALAGLSHPFIWTHFGDGDGLPEVQALVQSFPPHGEARLLGRVSNSQVLKHYATEPVDMFVNVSTTEGVPVSIMEALAAGVPCLATNAGATCEIADDTVGCILPVALTPEALRAAIEAELSPGSRWGEKRALARQRAEARCDARQNYDAFLQLLRLEAAPRPGEALGGA